MKNKIFLGGFMTIALMIWAKPPSGLQHYEEAPYTICSNTNNDEFELTKGEENMQIPFCDLPPQD